MRITAAAAFPPSQPGDWTARWEGQDHGLIAAWFAGREYAQHAPDVAEQARRGVLVALPFKRGATTPVKGMRWGTLLYVAMWQGMRGEDLDIDPTADVRLTCSSTGGAITYTLDSRRWREA